MIGEYELTIDTKFRMAVPSDIRLHLNPDTEGTSFYLTMGESRTLCLYPDRTFDEMTKDVPGGLVPSDAIREFKRMLFPLTVRLSFDGAGRVRLPEKMLKRAGLPKKTIVLVGVQDHLEIHDREQWEQDVEDRLNRQTEIMADYAKEAEERMTGFGGGGPDWCCDEPGFPETADGCGSGTGGDDDGE